MNRRGIRITKGFLAFLLSLSMLFSHTATVHAATATEAAEEVLEKAPAATSDGNANEGEKKTDAEPGAEETDEGPEAEGPEAEEPEAEEPVAEDPVEEAEPTYSVELSVEQGSLDGDGNKLLASVTVSYSEGSIPSEAVGKYVVYVYAGTGKKYENLTADGAISFKPFNIKGGNTYDVYAVLKDGDEVVAESTHRTITVVRPVINKSDLVVESAYEGEDSGTVTVNVSGIVSLEYYKENNLASKTRVEGNVITGLSKGKYYVYTPAYTDGDTFYIASSKQPATIGETEKPKYLIKTVAGDNLSWTKSEVEIFVKSSTSVYVRPAEDYYISRVYALPEGNADVSWYESTNEVYVSNITGDITLYAEATAKNAPAKIEITDVSFNKNGIYSEENPYIQTEITVKLTDRDGNPVPETDVFFKTDKTEVSYIRKTTDKDGVAVLKNSYGIAVEQGDLTASYYPIISADNEFKTLTVETSVNLVLQQKKNLELYEDQITGSRPEYKEGSVKNVPDGYEIWTGEVHDAVIVLYTGTWEGPVDGEFTGLSSGWQLLRFGEKVDAETNTFWFASDHEPFYVPRIEHAVIEDNENTDEPTDTTGEGNGSDTTPSVDQGGNTVPAQNNEPASNSTASQGAIVNTPAAAPVVNAPADNEETEEASDEDTEVEAGPEDTSEEGIRDEETAKADTAESESEEVITEAGVALAAGPAEADVAPNYVLWGVLALAILLALTAGTYGYYRFRKKSFGN